MEELPKFVRERLQQSSPGEAHPDPNLLSAFVENALTPRERAQVLEHLSGCAACRAIAGFALPGSEAAPAPVLTAEQRRWARWTVLRWGTLAASAVVIAIAVLVVRPQDHREAQFSPITQDTPPAAAERENAQLESKTKAAAEPPSAEEPQTKTPAKPAPARHAAPAKGKDQFTAASRNLPAPTGAQPQGLNAARADAKAQVTSNFAFQAQQQQQRAGGPYVTSNQALNQANQANQAQMPSQQNAVVAMVPAAPPPPPSTRAKTNEVQPRMADSVGAMAETVEVTGAAPAMADKKETAKTAAKHEITGQSAVGGLLRGRPVQGVALKQSQVRWTISSEGKITRSLDGQTWAEVPVGDGVLFRAISANGADLWAGGSGGALFHSPDGGDHWTRVRPAVPGAELTADIIRIEFTDPQHGSVLTGAGEKWMTSDGGRGWSLTR